MSVNVVLPMASRNSREYVLLGFNGRDDDEQINIGTQHKKHKNTDLPGERGAAACVCAAIQEKS